MIADEVNKQVHQSPRHVEKEKRNSSIHEIAGNNFCPVCQRSISRNERSESLG
ncbi:MAG: hypothetical protein KGJ13_13040 [Patescibacteria group bacterium]|nr:hypothetical protein [Patescibacteria group bacterium]